MAKISMSHIEKLSDAAFGEAAHQVVAQMTGNANFTTPVPSLATITTAIDAFDTTNVTANEGSFVAKSTRNDNRASVYGLLDELRYYVEGVAKGDRTILLSAGFPLAKDRQSVGVLDKPSNFSVTPRPTRGSVQLKLKAIRGAESYSFEYAPAPVTANSVWIQVQSSKASLLINDLTSGVEYVFRVCGVGASPERVYSDQISSFVL